MNSETGDLSTWSRREWVIVIVLILAAHLALTYWLGDETVSLPAHVSKVSPIRFSTGNAAKPGSTLSLVDEDPTVFALVTPHSFSEAAWLTVPRFKYVPGSPVEPAHWLSPPTDELADDFAEFVQTNVFPEGSWSSRLAPVYTRIPLPASELTTATRVIVEGDLAGRKLLSESFPLNGEQIMTRTVVRVTVNSAGSTVSAVLWSRCGVDKADGDALNFAKHARFAPLGRDLDDLGNFAGEKLSFGNLVFQWSQMQSKPSLVVR